MRKKDLYKEIETLEARLEKATILNRSLKKKNDELIELAERINKEWSELCHKIIGGEKS